MRQLRTSDLHVDLNDDTEPEFKANVSVQLAVQNFRLCESRMTAHWRSTRNRAAEGNSARRQIADGTILECANLDHGVAVYGEVGFLR